MDIGALSMGMSNASLSSAVSLAVTKLQMNSNDQIAAGLTEMMGEMAVDPNLGSKLDVQA